MTSKSLQSDLEGGRTAYAERRWREVDARRRVTDHVRTTGIFVRRTFDFESDPEA